MDKQITEHGFFQEVDSLARTIIEEYGYTSTDDDYSDGCHEAVDGHQLVIYYYQAQQVCNLPSSVTDAGEEWLEDVYETPYAGCATFGEVCTRLAFASLLQHVEQAVYELLEEMEAA